jgi:translocator protein
MRGSILVATATGVGVTAIAGSLASRNRVDEWYRRLRKPAFVPPEPVFPVAWTVLYVDIAAASATVIERLRDSGRSREARAYTAALAVNLCLNASWSWLFFNRRQLGVSALTAAALSASGFDLARRTADANTAAGAALLPYPLWCAFATVMSAAIWRRNRNHERPA